MVSLCPYLPVQRAMMDWRVYQSHGEERGEGFYRAALEYGNFLWGKQLPARAILCLDRAFGADLRAEAPVLREWPLPYAAMAWLLANLPEGVFCGNPRAHFQHFADRMNEPRRLQRQWRAWACWAITRRVRPELTGDPKHVVVEPTENEIGAKLRGHGLTGETEVWQAVLAECAAGEFRGVSS